jgi:hypothetical protein
MLASVAFAVKASNLCWPGALELHCDERQFLRIANRQFLPMGDACGVIGRRWGDAEEMWR